MITGATSEDRLKPDRSSGGANRGTVFWTAVAGLATFAALTHLRELAGIALLARTADLRFALLALAAETWLFAATGLLYATTFRAAGTPASLRRLALVGLGAHFINLVSKSGGFGGVALFLNEGRRQGLPRSRTVIAYLTTTVLGYAAYFATLAVAFALLYFRGSLTRRELAAAAIPFGLLVIALAVSLFALARQTRTTALLERMAQAANAAARLLGRGPVVSAIHLQTVAAELRDAARTVLRRPARYLVPLFFALSVEGSGVAVLYMVGLALHAGIGPQTAVAAYALTVLFSMISLTPGGLGIVEASLSLLLISLGMEQHKAIAVALSYRLFEFWIPFATGVIALRMARLRSPSGEEGQWHQATPPGGQRMTAGERRARSRTVAALAAAVGALNIVRAMTPAPLTETVHNLDPRLAPEGTRFALALLGLVLFRSAWSLLQRNRTAWALALGAAMLSTVVDSLQHPDPITLSLTWSLVAVLLVWRRTFRASSDRSTARRFGPILAGAVALGTVYGTAAVLFSARESGQSIGLVQALAQAARLALSLPATDLGPAAHPETWLIDSLHVWIAASLFVALSQVMHPVIQGADNGLRERERVNAILREHGESSLAFFALLPDKSYFFSPGGRSVLAYKVVGNTAVVMGDPIGHPAEFQDLLLAFEEQCDLNGWAFGLHQASPRYLDLYHSLGLRTLKIGEEAVLQLGAFSLRGNRMKHLRAAVNRLQREGYRVELLRPPLDDATLQELRVVSDGWLAQPGRRERTFAQGQFNDEYLRQCPVMTVRHEARGIVAFANIVPSFRSRQGNFDLVRYRQEPPALADVLYVFLALHFQDAGFEGMNLGLAPLAGLDGSRSLRERLLRLVYQHGESLFRYRGLREFKDKFDPRWEPRYLVYASDWQLPGLLLAVARAGETRNQRQSQPRPRLRLQTEPA